MVYDKNIAFNDLPDLPPVNINSAQVLRHTIIAARNLAELKGLCETLPDPALLLNTIVLQESRDSSAIENIVTTQDELYRANADVKIDSTAAKEVLRYREAMYTGLRHMKEKINIISTNTLVSVVQIIKDNKSGIRTQPGTNLKSSITGEVIYTPPCCENEIRQKLAALELFINETKEDHPDPLVKLALIHYQFEAIHPFVDGNGRVGRILNNLFLVQQDLLPHPVLYLSHYIAEHKQDYYQLLRRVTEQQEWTDWILFILTAIGRTAQLTTQKIRALLELRINTETRMKKVLQTSYSPDLLQLLFTQPYIKIETLVKKELAHRQTASVWLKKMVAEGILEPQKKGRLIYYVHKSLMDILSSGN